MLAKSNKKTAVHFLGNFTEALRIVHEMLETNPNSSFAQASKTVYENEVSQMDVVQHNITKEVIQPKEPQFEWFSEISFTLN